MLSACIPPSSFSAGERNFHMPFSRSHRASRWSAKSCSFRAHTPSSVVSCRTVSDAVSTTCTVVVFVS